MKLDYDCIREVLLITERDLCVKDENGTIVFDTLMLDHYAEEIPDYYRENICYTILKLCEADYLEASISPGDGGIYSCIVTGMTFAGHDFLNKIRDPQHWSKVKSMIPVIKDYSIFAIKTVAEAITTAAIQRLIMPGQ